MTGNDFERELERRLGELEAPEEVERRLVEASRAWVSGSARRRRRRRRVTVAVTIGLVLSGGTAAAVTLLHPFGWGLSVPAGQQAAQEIDRSPVLSRAPWLRQPGGTPRIDQVPALPSVVFPAGTTYQQALEALLKSVVERGSLPAEAELAAPLAPGVVWSPEKEGSLPALDLRAPWGYTLPGGLIRTPSYSLPGSLPSEKVGGIVRALQRGQPLGEPLPAGIRVEAPALASCQVAAAGRVACQLERAPKG